MWKIGKGGEKYFLRRQTADAVSWIASRAGGATNFGFYEILAYLYAL